MFKYTSKTDMQITCLSSSHFSCFLCLLNSETILKLKRFTSFILNKNPLAIQMLLPDVLWYISQSEQVNKKSVNMLLKTTLYVSVLPLPSFPSTSTVSQQPESARRLKTTSKPLTLSKHDVLAGGPEIASWLWIGCIPVYVSTRVCLGTCLLFS